MAENLGEQIARVRSKASILVEKYLLLREAFENGRNEIAELKGELIAKNAEIEKLRLQVEYLSIASTVKMSSEDIESTRALVANLVREIDRCISDLSE